MNKNMNKLKINEPFIKTMVSVLVIVLILVSFSAHTTSATIENKFSESEVSAVCELRDKLLLKEKHISINVEQDALNKDNIWELADKIYNAAVSEEYANNNKAGSYLSYQVGNMIMSYDYIKSFNGKYIITLVYEIDEYMTTIAQEKAIDDWLSKNKNRIANQNDNDYTKIKKICRFVENTVDYDTNNVSNNEYTLRNTMYQAVLGIHKVVCTGYAVTTHRLFREFGLDSVIVNNGKHVWNVVKCDGRYYYVDTTWEDEYHKSSSDDRWTLKGTKNYRYWQDRGYDHSLSSEYKTTAFKKRYPVELNSYVPKPEKPTTKKTNTVLKSLKQPKITKCYKSKKAVVLKWKNFGKVSGVYLEYSTDKNFKKNKKTIKLRGNKTKYKFTKLKKNKKYYFRVKTFKTSEKMLISNYSKPKSTKTKK